jgi:hypothetical protein
MVWMAQFPGIHKRKQGWLFIGDAPTMGGETAGQGKARGMATTSKIPHRVSGQVERETELAGLSAPAVAACPGCGATVLTEGPVGIGKTELLDAACAQAQRAVPTTLVFGDVNQPRAHVCLERGQNNAGQHHNCHSQ